MHVKHFTKRKLTFRNYFPKILLLHKVS